MDTETMKAFVITAPSTGGVQVIQRFAPKPGEILVRSKAAAICTLDRRLYSGRFSRYPAIGGHELAGVVDWVGENIGALKPGDRVAIDVMNRCGRCYYCLKGSNNICVDLAKSRSSEFFVSGGGFAEYVPVVAQQAFKLPEDLDLTEASLIEPLACCLHSVKRGQLLKGETAAILGAGTMGALHLLIAKLWGARCIVSDPDEARLRFALSNGADLAVNPAANDPVEFVRDNTEGRGADVVFVTASSPKAGEHALAMVARTGRVVLYGSLHPAQAMQLDWNRVHYQEITVTGSANNASRDFQDATGLVASRAVNLRPLVSKVIGLDELPGELMSYPKGAMQRVVVKL